MNADDEELLLKSKICNLMPSILQKSVENFSNLSYKNIFAIGLEFEDRFRIWY